MSEEEYMIEIVRRKIGEPSGTVLSFHADMTKEEANRAVVAARKAINRIREEREMKKVRIRFRMSSDEGGTFHLCAIDGDEKTLLAIETNRGDIGSLEKSLNVITLWLKQMPHLSFVQEANSPVGINNSNELLLVDLDMLPSEFF